MKKFLTLGLVMMLLSFAASAQNENQKQQPTQNDNVAPFKNRSRDPEMRYEMRKRRFGILNPIERRRLHRARCLARRKMMMMRRGRKYKRVI